MLSHVSCGAFDKSLDFKDFGFLTNENFPFILSNKCHSQKFPIKPYPPDAPWGPPFEKIFTFWRISMCHNIWHSHIARVRRDQVDKIVIKIVKDSIFLRQNVGNDSWRKWINWPQFSTIWRLKNRWRSKSHISFQGCLVWVSRVLFNGIPNVRNRQIFSYWFRSIKAISILLHVYQKAKTLQSHIGELRVYIPEPRSERKKLFIGVMGSTC